MKRLLAIAVLLAASTLAGCTGLYSRLPRVEDVPEFAQLAHAADALPWNMHRVAVLPAGGKPFAMAVYDNEQMDAKEVLLLVHGLTADNTSWRFMRGALTDYRIIAIDLPGCGQSDAPDLADMGPEGYSPTGLARCALQAFRAHLAAHPAADYTLVSHSLGGAVAMRMFGDDELRHEYRDVLGRVKSVVLYAPVHMRITEMPASIRTAANAQDWQVVAAYLLGLIPDISAGIVRDGVEFDQCALREIADREIAFLLDTRKRHVMQWMIQSIIASREGKIVWKEAEQWVENYRQITMPCLIVWGTRDPILNPSFGYEMQRAIPRSRLCIISYAHHSITLEQPRLCARLLRDCVEDRLPAQDVFTLTAQAPELVRPPSTAPAARRSEDSATIAQEKEAAPPASTTHP